MTDHKPPPIPVRVEQPGFAGWLTRKWFHCLVLGLGGFLVRIPALQGDAIWDDDSQIPTNPSIKSPLSILETFRPYLFQDTFSLAYRPVQNLSYLFDYLVWNNNFYGYHLTSLVCHVAGGILLYLLLQRLLPSLRPQSATGGLSTSQCTVG